MVDQQHGEELVEAGTQNWDGWGLDYQAAVWGRASTMESSEQGVISPIGRLAHYKHNRKSVSAQVQHWNTRRNVCFTSLLNCYFIYLWMNWKWVLVEWSPLVELPSFWASAQPAAPSPLLVGHPVLWNRGRSSKSGTERMQKMCSGPYKKIKIKLGLSSPCDTDTDRPCDPGFSATTGGLDTGIPTPPMYGLYPYVP